MATKAQSKATNKYNKRVYKQYAFRLRIKEDADVIKHLEAQQNKADYLRELIKNDIH